FFSSRRRHTRWPRDWSSDVCSSDLKIVGPDPALPAWPLRQSSVPLPLPLPVPGPEELGHGQGHGTEGFGPALRWTLAEMRAESRSEERRVGKEGRYGGRSWRGKEVA